jgi:recombination protein RecA
LRIRKEKQIKLEDQAIGHCIQVRVDKNKIAPPFKTAIFDLIYAKGISKTREIIDLATKLNILQLSGSWFAYNNKKLGQGKAALETYLESNPSLQQTLIEKIKSQL